MQGCTIWFTGLSGAGKSTLSTLVEEQLRLRRTPVETLDGDVIRTHLSKGLSFSREDRDTNVLRIGFVAQLLTRHGVVCLTAAISPYAAVREQVRANVGRFVEVFCDAPLEVVAKRDVKGLYKKAMAGEIANFTGVSDPYEPPLKPEVHVKTDTGSPVQHAATVLRATEMLGFIPKGPLPCAVDEAGIMAQLRLRHPL